MTSSRARERIGPRLGNVSLRSSEPVLLSIRAISIPLARVRKISPHRTDEASLRFSHVWGRPAVAQTVLDRRACDPAIAEF